MTFDHNTRRHEAKCCVCCHQINWWSNWAAAQSGSDVNLTFVRNYQCEGEECYFIVKAAQEESELHITCWYRKRAVWSDMRPVSSKLCKSVVKECILAHFLLSKLEGCTFVWTKHHVESGHFNWCPQAACPLYYTVVMNSTVYINSTSESVHFWQHTILEVQQLSRTSEPETFLKLCNIYQLRPVVWYNPTLHTNTTAALCI